MLQTAHNQVKKQLLYGNGGSTDALTISHMENLRNMDIGIIKQLSVKYILDLMTENKKKKFGFNVCSSEKVDMHDRYAPFAIASIPYPGVEFFQEFNQRKHCANDLHFDWNKLADYVELKVDHINCKIAVPWEEYKNWDLVMLTQNYLKLMLQFISDGSPGDSGLLVHCISGWDRTPLFISLLRISMWADGEIHQSLSAAEILYLTVAYDWLLFSHQLSDRASRGEDIFYFCFYFLQFIYSPEFSVQRQHQQHQPQHSPRTHGKHGNGNQHGHANGRPHSHTHTHVHNHSHHHNGTSRAIPTPTHIHNNSNSSSYNSNTTSPIDVPSNRAHSRKVSDGCCESDDCTCGSWQLLDGFSLTDRFGSMNHDNNNIYKYSYNHSYTNNSHNSYTPTTKPAPLYSYTGSDPNAATFHTTDTDSASSYSSSSSSSHFECIDNTGTSWENEGVFTSDGLDTNVHSNKNEGKVNSGTPQQQSQPLDQLQPDQQSSEDGEEGGTPQLIDGDLIKRRALLLSQIGEMGVNYYKQCCVPQQIQANNSNWMPQGIWRLLPRFVQ
jgi:myotubularin-related protein 14